jgi:hypothetical protein
VINVFIGLCGLMAFARWFDTDISSVNFITGYIDLNANTTRDGVVRN